MLIHVKTKHIRQGKQANCFTCPVALALKEATGYAASVDFHKLKFYNHRYETVAMIVTPKVVAKWIAAFDKLKKNAKPFRFRLKIINVFGITLL